jgi:hypothetical protein
MPTIPLPCQKLLLAFCVILSLKVNAQSSLGAAAQVPMDSLARQFVNYIRSEKKEKIIVLTDKSFYLAGETMWLKAWCLDAVSNHFARISKNLFVDLVDDRDSVVSQLLFNLDQQRTNGKILLPGSLKEGYYWLRGYTRNILAEDSNRIFVRPVYVLNGFKPDRKALSAHARTPALAGKDSAAPGLRFFPEGGSIISGTTANVAFRASDGKGRPLDLSGYVTDTRNDTVARFNTSMPGLGRFSFDAYNPRQYLVHIKGPQKEWTYPLPKIDQFAYQLSVVSRTEHMIRVRVSLGDSLYKKNKASRLLGISRDNLCFAASGTDMYEVDIPVANFPRGRATLYLFDDQSRIVSLRPLYVFNPDTASIVLTSDKPAYGLAEKVNLNISTGPQSNGHPLKALFAVSVADSRYAGEAFGIGTDHPGASGGDVDQPMIFSRDEMDLLLLTEGNLHPLWTGGGSPLSVTPVIHNADSNLLDVVGSAVDKSGAPLAHYAVNFFAADKGVFQLDSTDGAGRFRIHLPDYDDGTQFGIKITDRKGRGKEGKIIMEKFPFPEFNTPVRLKTLFDESDLSALRRLRNELVSDTLVSGAGVLKPATVVATGGASYDKSKRVSQFSYIITSDQFAADPINGIVNAIESAPGFKTGVLGVVGSAVSNSGATISNGSMGIQSIIILDGVEIPSLGDPKSFLQTLDPYSIDFIEILTGPLTALYGVEGAGGVILINTVRNSKDVAQVNSQGLTILYPRGYANPADFPNPAASDKKDAKRPPVVASSPDQRSTLCWSANLLTDANGNARLNFFTPHEQSTYLATVYGITENGDLVSKKLQIKCQ